MVGAIPIVLEGEAAAALCAAVLVAMKAEGLVVVGPDRLRPFMVTELVEETGLSDSQVRRMVESGVFEKVKHTGRVLVTVASVREWQGGGK